MGSLESQRSWNCICYEMIILTFFSTVVALIDTALGGAFIWSGVFPSWSLVWVMALVVVFPRSAAGQAFIIGILLDIFSGSFWGSHSVALLVIVGLVSFLHQRLSKFETVNWLVLIVFGETVYHPLSQGDWFLHLSFRRVVLDGLLLFITLRFLQFIKGSGEKNSIK